MHKDITTLPSNRMLEVAPITAASFLEMERNFTSNGHTNFEPIISPSSSECCWKFEEQHTDSYENKKELSWVLTLRKSQSVSSGLHRERSFSYNPEGDDHYQELPLNNFQFWNFRGLEQGKSSLQELCGSSSAVSLLNQNHESSFGSNIDPLSNSSKFFIDDVMPLDGDFCQHSEDRSHDHFGEDCQHGVYGTYEHFVGFNKSSFARVCSRSHSSPSLELYESSPVDRLMPHRSISVEKLCNLDAKIGEQGNDSRKIVLHGKKVASFSTLNLKADTVAERVNSKGKSVDECVSLDSEKECKEISCEEKDFMTQSRNRNIQNKFNDVHDSHSAIASLSDWRESEKDDMNHVNIQHGKTIGQSSKLNSDIFNVRRIEEWISQIDIQESVANQDISSSVPQEENEMPLADGANTPGVRTRGRGGVEAAYSYISSLAPSSTSVHMANLGLVLIPFLSAFSSLKVLNISCNAIVKITSRTLPRGLHVLNLSRNNISVVEGLRELTRLRILDLSYNRIARIGHGLGACSSLKELYLAGNKISEVEGLHRLLKLNILDLKFNKIYTTKCLGQLAANFASLQAINLEGNPAQRNVGEEQLKKYLLGLLPRLVYFNRHVIRASSMKELSDCPGRLTSSWQFDRGGRSDHRRLRTGNHAVASRMAPSLSHSRVVPTMGSSQKPPGHHRDRHTPLPSIGGKQLTHPQPSNPMRRSQSEGNF